MLITFSNVRSLALHSAFSPAGRAFFISLACWLLAFTYCRFKFWRDPHSAFFKSDHVYDYHYTSYRRSQGLSYLSNTSTALAAPKASSTPEICAAFVTVKREGEQYFDAALGSMLEGLTEDERKKLYVAILFADPSPEVHPSWGKEWLRAVDWSGGYEVGEDVRGYLRGLMERKEYKEKGVFDYLYTLELCHRTGAPYILMLEDDIIIADSWFIKTLHALRHISSTPALSNYLYLRLFYTETVMRWRQTDFVYRRMDFVLLSSALTTFLLLHSIRRCKPGLRMSLDTPTLLVLSLATVPSFIILLFMIGKYSLFPHLTQGVFIMNRYGCCSQALLFPRNRVPPMVQWFRDWKGVNGWPYWNTDVMIDYYADQIKVDRLALGPQVLQHVGLKSSRDNSEINGRSTRAFWFEEYDPLVLRKEHDQLVKTL
ncbi:hypothetical protein B0O99DRAFT_649795 [Bisporella sp. PMI_857]|nr:hypothetical protein B0O99DRAFT_649795 [Bisporella sp. PMI_857]